jgi:hypothetical protein
MIIYEKKSARNDMSDVLLRTEISAPVFLVNSQPCATPYASTTHYAAAQYAKQDNKNVTAESKYERENVKLRSASELLSQGLEKVLPWEPLFRPLIYLPKYMLSESRMLLPHMSYFWCAEILHALQINRCQVEMAVPCPSNDARSIDPTSAGFFQCLGDFFSVASGPAADRLLFQFHKGLPVQKAISSLVPKTKLLLVISIPWMDFAQTDSNPYQDALLYCDLQQQYGFDTLFCIQPFSCSLDQHLLVGYKNNDSITKAKNKKNKSMLPPQHYIQQQLEWFHAKKSSLINKLSMQADVLERQIQREENLSKEEVLQQGASLCAKYDEQARKQCAQYLQTYYFNLLL